MAWGIPATGVMVQTLLECPVEGDVARAEAAIESLAAAPDGDALVMREIWLLRMRTLLARARNDEAAYRDCRDRYRAVAVRHDFEGHVQWSAEMR